MYEEQPDGVEELKEGDSSDKKVSPEEAKLLAAEESKVADEEPIDASLF